MKKLSKIFFAMVFVFMFVLPVAFVGCDQKTNPKQLLSVEFVTNIKTEYTVGETIDFQGAKLRLVYDDDSKILIDPDASMISGFDTSTTGNKNMIVKYNGVQRTIAYSVNTFKLGEYHLYYAKAQNSYNRSSEVEDETTYLILNTNGTCVMRLFGTEHDFVWQYTDEDKIKITSVEQEEIYYLSTVQTTVCLILIDSGSLTLDNPTIGVFRHI